MSEADIAAVIKTATSRFDLRASMAPEAGGATVSRRRSSASALAAAHSRARYSTVDLHKLEQRVAAGTVDEDLVAVVSKRSACMN